MKKIFKYIIIVVIILGFSFLYAHINKEVPIFDKTVDSATYGNMGEMTTGLCVQQKFLCSQNVLNGISIKCVTYGHQLTSVYNYQILDGKTGKILREGILNAKEVKNNQYFTIWFDQITDCKNRELLFTLESKDASFGNALTVYNIPKGNEQAELRLNSDDFSENTLAIRTISTDFDWETFVGVSFYLLYLYIFIQVLFKFFS
ncbi:MAG: hypothetical protein HUJ74_01550 [Lachnospiraceae bacterium]|nr:hypothetical protein [Lachnospiraceae bacterium]